MFCKISVSVQVHFTTLFIFHVFGNFGVFYVKRMFDSGSSVTGADGSDESGLTAEREVSLGPFVGKLTGGLHLLTVHPDVQRVLLQHDSEHGAVHR